MQIEGKRILVTGASRGIGRTLAFALAREGAGEVVAGARQPIDIENLRSEAASANLNITPIRLDVTSDEDAMAAAASGRFDILVNNAGIAVYGSVISANFDEARAAMDVNYFGALRIVRALASAMIEHGDGLIVNVSTIFSKVSLPIVGTYCATKAALLSITQAMRADLNPHGVRAIIVMPTTTDTDMAAGADVPKMTKEFVASEIINAIRTEELEYPIGDEARGINEQLKKDPFAVEKMLSNIRA
jgi:hypothetical protein